MSDTREQIIRVTPNLPASRLSGVAILAFVLCLIPITFPLGAALVGLTVLHTRRRPDLSGAGLAKIGLTLGLGLMLSTTLFVVACKGGGEGGAGGGPASRNDERLPEGAVGPIEMANRIRCRANLRGLAKAIQIYANHYNDYPNVGAGYDPKKPGMNKGDSFDTTASLWLLVTAGGHSPGMFVCPSDKGTLAFKGKADDKNPFPDVDATAQANAEGGHRSWSYSYQIPNAATGGPGGVSSNSTRFAIMADRAPMNGDLLLMDKTVKDRASAATYLKNHPDKRFRINSPNHGGDGQNVLFQDGHVDWRATPCCGINDDNIYTVATGVVDGGATDFSPRTIGKAPTLTTGPFDQDDNVLVNIRWGTFCTTRPADK